MEGSELRSARARVAASGATSFRVILGAPELAAALPAAQRVAVLYDVQGQPCQARVRPVVEDGATRLDLIGRARRREAREFPRVTTSMLVLAQPARAAAKGRGITPVPDGELTEARVTLSASGMVLPLSFSPPDGSHIDLLLCLEDGEAPLAVRAQVLGSRASGVAIEFTRPGSHLQERISEFVHRRYLTALAAGP